MSECGLLGGGEWGMYGSLFCMGGGERGWVRKYFGWVRVAGNIFWVGGVGGDEGGRMGMSGGWCTV